MAIHRKTVRHLESLNALCWPTQQWVSQKSGQRGLPSHSIKDGAMLGGNEWKGQLRGARQPKACGPLHPQTVQARNHDRFALFRGLISAGYCVAN